MTIVIGQKRLLSGKNCCIRAKVVKVGKKWFYSGKSSSNRAKVVVFGQSGFIWEGLLY